MFQDDDNEVDPSHSQNQMCTLMNSVITNVVDPNLTMQHNEGGREG